MAQLTASGGGGHAASMHALSDHVHHLTNLILATPAWRALITTAVCGLVLQLAPPTRTALAAGFTVLAGSIALALPASLLWHTMSVARLPGALLLLTLSVWAAKRPGRTRFWLLLLMTAALMAWWLRGAPVASSGIASVVPVFLGLLAASAVVRRLAARDTGWASVGAAVSLAVSIGLAGGSINWAYAALLPAVAGLVLLGRADAAATLAQATTVVAVAAIVAADRGRLVPVDLAALAPLVVWFVAPRLLPRLNRAGPALAAGLAAACGLAAMWAATRVLWAR